MKKFDLFERTDALGKGSDDGIAPEKNPNAGEKVCLSILESIEDCVAIIQAGKIVYCNQAFERFAERIDEEILRLLFPDRVFLEEREQVRAFYGEEKRAGGLDRFTAEIDSSNGRRETMDIRVGDVEYEGMPAKVAVMRDVTPLLRRERESSRHLKMEAIGTVTGGFAHDFNNILGIVLGYGEMALEEAGQNVFLKRSVEEICAAALRGKNIILTLIGFSHKRGACLTALFAGPLLEESMERIEESAPPFVRWKKRISCEHEMIAADESEIETLLANICSNSANSFQGAPGTIRVEAESSFVGEEELESFFPGGLRPGIYVRLKIADSGCGIEPSLIDRVFDPYFTTKSLAERSGMGLSVVYGIVKKCNGAVRICSKVGVGTTVETLFPVL